MLWADPGAARRILAEIPEGGPLEEWAYRRALVLRAILADHEGDGLALARARERILREFPSIRGKKVDPIVSRFLDIEAAPSLPEIPGLPAVVTSPERRSPRGGRAPRGRRP